MVLCCLLCVVSCLSFGLFVMYWLLCVVCCVLFAYRCLLCCVFHICCFLVVCCLLIGVRRVLFVVSCMVVLLSCGLFRLLSCVLFAVCCLVIGVGVRCRLFVVCMLCVALFVVYCFLFDGCVVRRLLFFV